jgi:lipopolysaccharide export system ATP-binding protein
MPKKKKTDTPPLLWTEGLKKSFKSRMVVNDVNIQLAEGEVVGLLGANGAGKTTTFSMVVGLLKPDQGRIHFNGQDITKKAMYKRARLGMAYLAQEPSVFRDLTARDNILAILEYRNMSKAERSERTDALMEELDITSIADTKAYALSGGERRRVEIARALATDPKVFLLDEPFAGIDPIAVADLQQTVHDLKNRGIGVLITDHNVRETLQITDRAYILNEGTILTSGTPKEIAKDPLARKTYLGEHFKMDFRKAKT